uniref:Chromosome partition protein Smc n=1 Tax=uncultured Thermoplasmata archaeon TaxID=376542 RepID=A0A871YEF6_9ARCH|nr:hypothetical protein HULAa36F11_00019 [uncultured Thermoplasmata archaeon]
MDRNEVEKLERERAKLEKARERLEEERQKFEDERQAMEEARQELEDERDALDDEKEALEEEAEDMKEEERERIRDVIEQHREMLREKAEQLNERQREKMEKLSEQLEKAMEGVQDKIENSIAGIDFGEMGNGADKDLKDMGRDMKNIAREIRICQDTKNVGVLNLKDITPEELDKMGEIRNAGVIIAPEELIGRISAKISKNMGTIVPYKKGWRIYSGYMEFDRAMLEALEEPIEFISIGYLSVEKDVSAELLKAKIRAFHNYGQVSATEETYGIIKSKCLENYGQINKNGHDEEESPGHRGHHRHRGEDE